MRIGAHVGIGQGWVKTVGYCVDVGAECLQVFSKSPRTWRSTALDLEVVKAFRQGLTEHDIGPLFVHTSYLINLGSDDPSLWHRSIDALAEEFRRAAVVGAEGLVIHVGTNPFGDAGRAAERIALAVQEARVATDSGGRDVPLLLENSAGAGSHFGGPAEEIGLLSRSIRDHGAGPVGVCLDTCHAFAQGYSLETSADWNELLDAFETARVEAPVDLVHANDCRHGRGEHRDRHEWIGDGGIGMDGFRTMFGLERLQDTPVIIEMPGDLPEKDRENVVRLKALRAGILPRSFP